MFHCRPVGTKAKVEEFLEVQKGGHDWLNSVLKLTLLAFTVTIAVVLPTATADLEDSSRSQLLIVGTFLVIGSYGILLATSGLNQVFVIAGLVRNPLHQWAGSAKSFQFCLQIFTTVLRSLVSLVYVGLIVLTRYWSRLDLVGI